MGEENNNKIGNTIYIQSPNLLSESSQTNKKICPEQNKPPQLNNKKSIKPSTTSNQPRRNIPR